jgi:hypothetical protein
MTELDRQAAVAVFRASLPRRGAKGHNDSAVSGSAICAAHQLVGALTHAEIIQEPPGLERADHAAVGACLVSNIAHIGAPTQAA